LTVSEFKNIAAPENPAVANASLNPLL